jgi:hypothetical protein
MNSNSLFITFFLYTKHYKEVKVTRNTFNKQIAYISMYIYIYIYLYIIYYSWSDNFNILNQNTKDHYWSYILDINIF